MRVRPEERDRIARDAERLGVSQPFAGPYLRQNWGRCVFWSDGCRLHAELGVEAKPGTCRQFPFVFAGDAVAIDPACFHAEPTPAPDGDAPVLRLSPAGPPAPDPGPLDWDALEHGRSVADTLERLPLAAIVEGPLLGPRTREVLAGLGGARPIVPVGTDRERLDARARTVLRFGLAPAGGLERLLVGGGQLIAGAGIPVGPGFAAWVRLLRTGVV